MIAGGDNRDRQRVETAGLWVRATIATLLLAAAAVMTAYTLNVNDFSRPEATLERAAPTELAEIPGPSAPNPLDAPRATRQDAQASAASPYQVSRRDASAASASR